MLKKPHLKVQYQKHRSLSNKTSQSKMSKKEGKYLSNLNLISKAEDIYFKMNDKRIHLSTEEKSLIIPFLVRMSLNDNGGSLIRTKKSLGKPRHREKNLELNYANMSNKTLSSENPAMATKVKKPSKATITVTTERGKVIKRSDGKEDENDVTVFVNQMTKTFDVNLDNTTDVALNIGYPNDTETVILATRGGVYDKRNISHGHSKSKDTEDLRGETLTKTFERQISKKASKMSATCMQTDNYSLIDEREKLPNYRNKKLALRSQSKETFKSKEGHMVEPEHVTSIEEVSKKTATRIYHPSKLLFSVNVSGSKPTEFTFLFGNQEVFGSNMPNSQYESIIKTAMEDNAKKNVYDAYSMGEKLANNEIKRTAITEISIDRYIPKLVIPRDRDGDLMTIEPLHSRDKVIPRHPESLSTASSRIQQDKEKEKHIRPKNVDKVVTDSQRKKATIGDFKPKVDHKILIPKDEKVVQINKDIKEDILKDKQKTMNIDTSESKKSLKSRASESPRSVKKTNLSTIDISSSKESLTEDILKDNLKPFKEQHTLAEEMVSPVHIVPSVADTSEAEESLKSRTLKSSETKPKDIYNAEASVTIDFEYQSPLTDDEKLTKDKTSFKEKPESTKLVQESEEDITEVEPLPKSESIKSPRSTPKTNLSIVLDSEYQSPLTDDEKTTKDKSSFKEKPESTILVQGSEEDITEVEPLPKSESIKSPRSTPKTNLSIVLDSEYQSPLKDDQKVTKEKGSFKEKIESPIQVRTSEEDVTEAEPSSKTKPVKSPRTTPKTEYQPPLNFDQKSTKEISSPKEKTLSPIHVDSSEDDAIANKIHSPDTLGMFVSNEVFNASMGTKDIDSSEVNKSSSPKVVKDEVNEESKDIAPIIAPTNLLDVNAEIIEPKSSIEPVVEQRESMKSKSAMEDGEIVPIAETPQNLELDKKIESFTAKSVNESEALGEAIRKEILSSMASEQISPFDKKKGKMKKSSDSDVKSILLEMLSIYDIDNPLDKRKLDVRQVLIKVAEIDRLKRLYTDTDITGSPITADPNLTWQFYEDEVTAIIDMRKKSSDVKISSISETNPLKTLERLSEEVDSAIGSKGKKLKAGNEDLKDPLKTSLVKVSSISETNPLKTLERLSEEVDSAIGSEGKKLKAVNEDLKEPIKTSLVKVKGPAEKKKNVAGTPSKVKSKKSKPKGKEKLNKEKIPASVDKDQVTVTMEGDLDQPIESSSIETDVLDEMKTLSIDATNKLDETSLPKVETKEKASEKSKSKSDKSAIKKADRLLKESYVSMKSDKMSEKIIKTPTDPLKDKDPLASAEHVDTEPITLITSDKYKMADDDQKSKEIISSEKDSSPKSTRQSPTKFSLEGSITKLPSIPEGSILSPEKLQKETDVDKEVKLDSLKLIEELDDKLKVHGDKDEEVEHLGNDELIEEPQKIDEENISLNDTDKILPNLQEDVTSPAVTSPIVTADTDEKLVETSQKDMESNIKDDADETYPTENESEHPDEKNDLEFFETNMDEKDLKERDMEKSPKSYKSVMNDEAKSLSPIENNEIDQQIDPSELKSHVPEMGEEEDLKPKQQFKELYSPEEKILSPIKELYKETDLKPKKEILVQPNIDMDQQIDASELKSHVPEMGEEQDLKTKQQFKELYSPEEKILSPKKDVYKEKDLKPKRKTFVQPIERPEEKESFDIKPTRNLPISQPEKPYESNVESYSQIEKEHHMVPKTEISEDKKEKNYTLLVEFLFDDFYGMVDTENQKDLKNITANITIINDSDLNVEKVEKQKLLLTPVISLMTSSNVSYEIAFQTVSNGKTELEESRFLKISAIDSNRSFLADTIESTGYEKKVDRDESVKEDMAMTSFEMGNDRMWSKDLPGLRIMVSSQSGQPRLREIHSPERQTKDFEISVPQNDILKESQNEVTPFFKVGLSVSKSEEIIHFKEIRLTVATTRSDSIMMSHGSMGMIREDGSRLVTETEEADNGLKTLYSEEMFAAGVEGKTSFGSGKFPIKPKFDLDVHNDDSINHLKGDKVKPISEWSDTSKQEYQLSVIKYPTSKAKEDVSERIYETAIELNVSKNYLSKESYFSGKKRGNQESGSMISSQVNSFGYLEAFNINISTTNDQTSHISIQRDISNEGKKTFAYDTSQSDERNLSPPTEYLSKNQLLKPDGADVPKYIEQTSEITVTSEISSDNLFMNVEFKSSLEKPNASVKKERTSPISQSKDGLSQLTINYETSKSRSYVTPEYKSSIEKKTTRPIGEQRRSETQFKVSERSMKDNKELVTEIKVVSQVSSLSGSIQAHEGGVQDFISVSIEINKTQTPEILKSSSSTKENSIVEDSMKKICDEIGNIYLDFICEELIDGILSGKYNFKRKISKSFSCERGISEQDDECSHVPIIEYKSHTCFNSGDLIKVKNHEEHSHIRLFKSSDPQARYKLTNTSWIKSEITLPGKSKTSIRPFKNACKAVDKITEIENLNILDRVINMVLNDDQCDTENSIGAFSEGEISIPERNIPEIRQAYREPCVPVMTSKPPIGGLERCIPYIQRRDTTPCAEVYIKQSAIWTQLPNCNGIQTPYGYQKVIVPIRSRYNPNQEFSSRNECEDFIIPQDGIFGRDAEEPKFVNFCCNTCHTWINLGNRSHHTENCVNNNVDKGSTDSAKEKSKPRLIKRMPGVVCFICGHRFTKHSILRHEKMCLIKWTTINEAVERKFRKNIPVKPQINGSDIAQIVKEQIDLGNSDYTAEDAINDFYYNFSRKNAIDFNN